MTSSPGAPARLFAPGGTRELLIDHYRRERSHLPEPIEEHLAPVMPGPEEALTASPELVSALQRLSERDRESGRSAPWSRFDPRRVSESTWLLTIARNLP